MSVWAAERGRRVHDAAATSRAVSDRGNGSWGYRVRGCNIAGCCPYSPIQSVSVLLAPTTVPSFIGVPGIVFEFHPYDIAWTSSPGASRYELEESLNLGHFYMVSNGPVTSVHRFNGQGAGRYRVRVRACNASGCTAWSALAYTDVIRPGGGGGGGGGGGCEPGTCDPLRAKEAVE